MNNKKINFAFRKINYQLMLACVVLILLGFVLMSGGGSEDPNVFNYEMFNTRRLTVAPLVILAGFLVGIYAIMKKPRD